MILENTWRLRKRAPKARAEIFCPRTFWTVATPLLQCKDGKYHDILENIMIFWYFDWYLIFLIFWYFWFFAKTVKFETFWHMIFRYFITFFGLNHQIWNVFPDTSVNSYSLSENKVIKRSCFQVFMLRRVIRNPS